MIDKLVGKIKKLNAPIVVGLDPESGICTGSYSEESI